MITYTDLISIKSKNYDCFANQCSQESEVHELHSQAQNACERVTPHHVIVRVTRMNIVVDV